MSIILIPPPLYIVGALMRGSSEAILKEKGFTYDYASDTALINGKKIRKRNQ